MGWVHPINSSSVFPNIYLDNPEYNKLPQNNPSLKTTGLQSGVLVGMLGPLSRLIASKAIKPEYINWTHTIDINISVFVVVFRMVRQGK